MHDWRDPLRYDPLPQLLSASNPALRFFARGDLLGETGGEVEALLELPAAKKILRRQQTDGAWPYPGGGKEHLRSEEDYNQLETFRQLGLLIEKHGINRRHPAVPLAAEFLLSKQTQEGDLRGIYGNQYSPNYTAAILELLIKAGYEDDQRVRKGLDWLLSMRQVDGGWAIPLRTVLDKFDQQTMVGETIQPARAKPFSHLATGVVLRALSAHPEYRYLDETLHAGRLLVGRLFLADRYPDRKAPSYWMSFSFPFWFTDLLSALDSLSKMGFKLDERRIAQAIDWLIEQQQEDGVWRLYLLRTGKDPDADLWISLVVCRVLRRFKELPEIA